MHALLHPSRLLPVLGAGLCFAAPLRADVISFSDSHDLSATDWTDTLTIPKFDPALGTLNSVELIYAVGLLGEVRIENTGPVRATIGTMLTVDVRLLDPFGPPGSLFLSLQPSVATSELIPGFDGTIDFGGLSGRIYPNLIDDDTSSSVYVPGNALFVEFVGPGSIGFDAETVASSAVNGPGSVVAQFTSSASANLTVNYTFTPVVIVDCNGNGIDDALDIANGTSLDCNTNGVPDECDPDCGTNGIPDDCEPDSDGDGIPDDCEAPPCAPIGTRNAGSLLLYPEFDNRVANLTLVTVTNTNCDFTPDGFLYAGTVDVEFVYVGRYGPGGVDLPCLEFNRTHRLSPCDTLTVWTSAHNPGQERGYLYVFAKSPQNGRAIVFNYLIGQEIRIGAQDDLNDSVNAVTFPGIGLTGDETDHDGDGIRDLDGVEYGEAPDEILVPRFLGQDPVGPQSVFKSRLILIALSGGTAFTTSLDFLIYNDNEEEFSAEHTFFCWDDPLLAEISGAFLETFLDGTNDAPGEILGATNHEAGWFKIDGDIAQSTAAVILDPAFYAVLVERASIYAVADLPFELCTQNNGDLLPTGVFGDI